MITDEGHRGPQVCKIVGITYRQMDYWVRTGLVRPSVADAHGSGTRRRWSDDDVRQLIVIKRMLDAGVSLMTVREVLPVVREMHAGFLVVGPRPAFVAPAAELVEALRGTVATVIDLAVEIPSSNPGVPQASPATVAS